MRTIKFLSILMLSVTFLGCKKKTSEDLNPDLRTAVGVCQFLNSSVDYRLTVYTVYLNSTPISVYLSETEGGNGFDFKLNGNTVSYSYSVYERTGTISSGTTKDYSGSINSDAFIKGSKNKVEIVRDGSDWKLLINGVNADVNTGTSTSPNGVWQRYGSPNGYQTDLAIGGIPGQPANRVYMCEHPGSPTAGLYKGYISGTTITWDAIHGLPNAEFDILNSGPDRTLYFGVGNISDAGKYSKGVWTNTCPM